MLTRLRCGLAAACLAAVLAAPGTAAAQQSASAPLGAAAAALRDSVPVFEDAAFTRPLLTLRLGDALRMRGRSDSVVTVVTATGRTAFVRLRDVGLIGLPAVKQGDVLTYGPRFQPYVVWYLARRFSGTRVADQWSVPPDRGTGRRLYARLVHEFPADTLVPAGLKIPDLHPRFGAIEGNLRQAEMDLADGDTATAVLHLRDAVERFPRLARVSSLDALFLSMIGDLETRAAPRLGAAARAHGVESLFRVLKLYPRDVVRGLATSRVPAFEAADALLDLSRFPAAEVIQHATQIVRIDSLPATRMAAWVARGRLELQRGRAARAESLAVLAARGEPDWIEAPVGQGPPLAGNPRPAMKLLSAAWRARGGTTAGLRTLQRLTADPALSDGLRRLAQQELAACLDHGPGSPGDIRALGLAAEDDGWRARLEAGGWSARVAAAGPPPVLRAGDWDSSSVVGHLSPGQQVEVVAVAAAWPGSGVAPHHRVKVRTADGVIGWTDGGRLARIAGSGARPSAAADSALALGALPPRARIVIEPPHNGLAPTLAAAGHDVAVTQFAFDTDQAAPPNPAGLIDGASGQVAWIRAMPSMTLPSQLHVLRAPSEPGRALAVLAPSEHGAVLLDGARGEEIGEVYSEVTLAPSTPPALTTSGDVIYTIERSAITATRVLPDTQFVQLWQRELTEIWAAVPPIAAGGLRAEGLADSLLLTGSGGSNPRMRAWSLRDGHELWTAPAPDATELFVAGPGIVLAYAGTEMWAAAATSGTLLWNKKDVGSGEAFGAFLTRPAVVQRERVLQLTNNALQALDPRTGAVQWTTELPQVPVSAPAAVPGDPTRVVVALSQGMLAYLDVRDGRVITLQPLRSWSTAGPTPQPGSSDPRWLAAYIVTTTDGLAVSADDGIVDLLGR